MHRLFAVAVVLCSLAAPSLAEPGAAAPAAATPASGVEARIMIQLAQSDCRGNCSSSRGYCLSTCRDSFCRAVCNDRYQSCLSSCRR